MNNKLKEIGARVREARLRLNISQTTLAELAQLHPTYISQIENGKANLSVEVFVRLTEVLQVSADWLLRSNVPSVNQLEEQELVSLFSDCSATERKTILKMIKDIKSALRESNP
ncbi:MAG: helix-turn-helix transcriptional regulator [Lachnospiraceae bacterium]|nr:helix-turn-helix transcriptional regulator [Lachnospiraceae bacterium]